jgi:phosphoribosyl-dephospho-CoA transferase
VPRQEIFAVMPPPLLTAVHVAAPAAWWPTLDCLGDLARKHRVTMRVFGGLAWAALTRLDYLTHGSDIDLLVSLQQDTDLFVLAAGIAAIEATAPMRLDGEFVRADGAAVNWREIHGGAQQVLVKRTAGVDLLDRAHFLDQGPTP